MNLRKAGMKRTGFRAADCRFWPGEANLQHF
jgi:hypothetical protein